MSEFIKSLKLIKYFWYVRVCTKYFGLWKTSYELLFLQNLVNYNCKATNCSMYLIDQDVIFISHNVIFLTAIREFADTLFCLRTSVIKGTDRCKKFAARYWKLLQEIRSSILKIVLLYCNINKCYQLWIIEGLISKYLLLKFFWIYLYLLIFIILKIEIVCFISYH